MDWIFDEVSLSEIEEEPSYEAQFEEDQFEEFEELENHFEILSLAELFS